MSIERELHFDILDDLSDELDLFDYVIFVMINDLSSELRYGIIRRVEYYYLVFDDLYMPIVCEGVALFTKADFACYLGDMEVLKWLYRNDQISDDTWLISTASLGGHLNILEWLYDECGIRFFQCSEIYACRKGYLGILKWLYERFPPNYRNSYHHRGMLDACHNGHLDAVKWMHEYKGVELPDIDNDDDCEIHSDVVKYMIEIGSCKRSVVVGWVHRGGNKDVLSSFS